MRYTIIIVTNSVHSISTSIDLRVRGDKTNREGLITFINAISKGVEEDAMSVRGGAEDERSRSREIMV